MLLSSRTILSDTAPGGRGAINPPNTTREEDGRSGKCPLFLHTTPPHGQEQTNTHSHTTALSNALEVATLLRVHH